MADYHKIGLITLRSGQLLLCRKRYGTSKWILPGGCIESGETPETCLRRELHEELGDVSVSALEYLGVYEDRAAHDNPDIIKTVEIQLYRGELHGAPSPASEIAELTWFGPESPEETLSPILRNKILPDLIRRGILPWTRRSTHPSR